ncbi:MAG: holo-ACP synthase [Chloroflexota bacterium]
MLRTGVDLIEIERIQVVIERQGERFLNRVYTPAELDYCAERAESLAARFAAKEAVAKALGTGIWRAGIGWQDIEVRRNEQSGAPFPYLTNAAADRAAELNLNEWSLSLSHERRYAIAFVVALS